MARLLLLNRKISELKPHVVDKHLKCKDNFEYMYNDFDFDCLLDKVLHTNCSQCINEFIRNLRYYGMFKYYWKPILFRRNIGKFEYESGRHILSIDVKIDPGHKSKHYMSRYNMYCHLTIKTKKGHHCGPKIKILELFNFYCNYDNREKIENATNFLKKYLLDSFGIDLSKWDEVLEHKYQYKDNSIGYNS